MKQLSEEILLIPVRNRWPCEVWCKYSCRRAETTQKGTSWDIDGFSTYGFWKRHNSAHGGWLPYLTAHKELKPCQQLCKHISQLSPTFLVPGTGFVEDSFVHGQWGGDGLGMIQVFILIVHFIYYYYISSISDHQTLDPWGWRPLIQVILPQLGLQMRLCPANMGLQPCRGTN